MTQKPVPAARTAWSAAFFDAIEMKKHPTEKKLKATVDPEKCFGCGLCAVVCDPGAATMKLARVEA